MICSVGKGGPPVRIVKLNDSVEGVGELESSAAGWEVCEDMEKVYMESDTVRFVHDGSRESGVFPVHMVFEPDRAGLAGGTGRGGRLEGNEEMGRKTDRSVLDFTMN